jgi:hypothetical protein
VLLPVGGEDTLAFLSCGTCLPSWEINYVPIVVGGEPRRQRPFQVPGVREGRGLAYPRADLAAHISRSAFRLARWAGALRRLRSWKLQEPKVERREHQDDPDVHHQPLPEPPSRTLTRRFSG